MAETLTPALPEQTRRSLCPSLSNRVEIETARFGLQMVEGGEGIIQDLQALRLRPHAKVNIIAFDREVRRIEPSQSPEGFGAYRDAGPGHRHAGTEQGVPAHIARV